MDLRITEPERWQLAWTVQSPLRPLLWGMGGGWLLGILLTLSASSPLRWPLILLLTGATGGAAAFLVRTLPREERGLALYPPDGVAVLKHTRHFLRKAHPWQAEGTLIALQIERARFAESGGRQEEMARLWAKTTEGERHLLTPWLAEEATMQLADALTPRLNVPLEER